MRRFLSKLSKNRVKRLLFLLILLVFSSLISLKAAYIIAETFFFDKFFYQKSIKHGYNQGFYEFSKFGERSKDLLELSFLYNQLCKNKDEAEKVLCHETKAKGNDEIYTVAVYGDSFVWGMGVKFENTVTQLLEKKLNRYKKTEVLSFGNPGDYIQDYILRYQMARKVYPIDLNIFVIFSDDAFPNPFYEETSVLENCESLYLDEKLTFNSSSVRAEDLPLSKVNLCIFEESVDNLPKENSIYFFPQIWFEKPVLTDNADYKYLKILKAKERTAITLNKAREIKKYSKYFSDPEKLPNILTVSHKDLHPSKLAHEMYADILYAEVIKNEKYGF